MDEHQIPIESVKAALSGPNATSNIDEAEDGRLDVLEAQGAILACWTNSQGLYRLRAELDGHTVETKSSGGLSLELAEELYKLALPILNARSR